MKTYRSAFTFCPDAPIHGTSFRDLILKKALVGLSSFTINVKTRHQNGGGGPTVIIIIIIIIIYIPHS